MTMTDTQGRHADAARSEPPGGASREEWAKALMKAAFRGPWQTPINTREETETGRALHPRFCDLLDVSSWVAQARLSRREGLILLLHYGPADLTIQETARRLNVHRATVFRERHRLIEAFLRWYYDEADYELPARVQALERERANPELRDLEWE